MRFFYEETIGTETFSLSNETARHVVQVLRMNIGDQFVLTNGNGLKVIVEIERIDKKNCTVRPIQQEEVKNDVGSIHVAISFTKNNTRMEWLLEKITEIGVRSIYPIITERSERKEVKLERFNKKMTSAMLQSQQYYLPRLHNPMAFTDLLQVNFDNKLIAHCENSIEKVRLGSLQFLDGNSKLLAIGPEGDFTMEEIQQALQHNFKSVSLGNNRLRTETAGLVGVTLLNSDA